jgi:hypothetical protein
MLKKMLVIFTALAILVAFCLPAFAETVKGKVTAYDKEAKKISIDEKEYSLSDEALSTEVAVGDEVEANVEGDVVQDINK